MGGHCTKRCASPSQTQLIDFTLVRSIGRGAFGKVCIVYHRGMKKHYALKYMPKRRLVAKSAVLNVLRELQLLQELSHPFIVNLWFTFQDEQYIYMASDLLLGGDLRYHLNEKRFSESRTKLYVCEIALALDYLHTRRIVHRDVKPDNILLDDKGHAHLTDFNLAMKLEPGRLATAFSGTRPYMAPEIVLTSLGQCNGYDERVDWWSLGVCFYEMMRGRRPFEFASSASSAQVLQLLLNGSVALPAQWPSDLISFVASLLNADPRHRIGSFFGFRQHRYMERIDFDNVLARRVAPTFIPKQDKLNCDPTFELEERLIESSPLHRHHERRLRRQNREDNGTPLSPTDHRRGRRSSNTPATSARTIASQQTDDAVRQLSAAFIPYNRFRSAAAAATLAVMTESMGVNAADGERRPATAPNAVGKQ